MLDYLDYAFNHYSGVCFYYAESWKCCCVSGVSSQSQLVIKQPFKCGMTVWLEKSTKAAMLIMAQAINYTLWTRSLRLTHLLCNWVFLPHWKRLGLSYFFLLLFDIHLTFTCVKMKILFEICMTHFNNKVRAKSSWAFFGSSLCWHLTTNSLPSAECRFSCSSKIQNVSSLGKHSWLLSVNLRLSSTDALG